MKIRGTVKITKDLIAPITGTSVAKDGKYGMTDVDGRMRWSDLIIAEVDINETYQKSVLVLDASGESFISIVNGASGSALSDLAVWKPFGSGGNDIPVISRPIGPWAAGTRIEDIMEACCYPNGISNLQLSGYSSTIPANTPVTDPTLTWNVTGSPVNMRLSDDAGFLTNIDVTGLTTYTPSGVTYNYSGGRTVNWTVTADGNTPITTSLEWVTTPVYDNLYYNVTGANSGTPSEATILAGTIVNIPTNPSFNVFVNEAFSGQNYFIAIPITQSHTFTYMKSDPAAPASAIGSAGSATTLEDKGFVTVNGASYHVYATAYATASGVASFGIELSN